MKTRNLILICILTVFAAMGQGREALRTDPVASARFLPFEAKIPAEKVLALKAALKFYSDSSDKFSMHNNTLKISFGLSRKFLGAGKFQFRTMRSRFVERINKKFNLEIALPDYFTTSFVPSDEEFDTYQWPLNNTGKNVYGQPGTAGKDINIIKVWEQFSGSDTLVIAVIDAGICFKHPELEGKIWHNEAEVNGIPGIDDDQNGFVDDSTGWNFAENNANPEDLHGHGTSVSGIIAANWNSTGIAGVLSECRIMPIKVMGAAGYARLSNVISGIYYAVDNGAHVINISMGGRSGNYSLQVAIEYAEAMGVPIIVAAGNSHLNLDSVAFYPANYKNKNIINVGSFGSSGTLSGFSNYGEASVHMAAPGEGLVTLEIPEKKHLFFDDFEGCSGISKWSLSIPKSFTVDEDSALEGKRCLKWDFGSNTELTMSDYVDLTGQKGAVLTFALKYNPADDYDALLVEGQVEGSQVWYEIAAITSPVDPVKLSYEISGFEGTRFKLRFRIISSSSTSGRTIKIDNVSIKVHDLNPEKWDNYGIITGTSAAAPHVTAYAGLVKLACDRMGVDFDREKIIQGYASDPLLAGKIMNSARLDVYKGLEFYLNSLPVIEIDDINKLTWNAGETVDYRIKVVGEGASNYNLEIDPVYEDAVWDESSEMMTIYNTTPDTYILNIRAYGPTTLKKKIVFGVISPVENSGPLSMGSNLHQLSWMGRNYTVPEGFDLNQPLKIVAFDARGAQTGITHSRIHDLPLLEQKEPAGRFYRLILDGRVLTALR